MVFSLEPLIAKVFERMVNHALRDHLKPLMSEAQHGFTPMRSTTINLACYMETLSQSPDKRCQVHSIYTDFHKAFLLSLP